MQLDPARIHRLWRGLFGLSKEGQSETASDRQKLTVSAPCHG